MNERENILEKIRKCMALAGSASGNEAETALRQAKKLMEMYQVSQAEMLAIDIKEATAKAGVYDRPSAWETELAARIADIFGCHLMFRSGFLDSASWLFIGMPPANDVAAYSFEVLFRQAGKARRAFMATSLKRFKKSNKTRRADLFCQGWVRTAVDAVTPLTPVDGVKEAIQAYLDTKYKNRGELDSMDRNKGRELSDKDYMARAAGMSAGKHAQINKGVGADAGPRLLGGV